MTERDSEKNRGRRERGEKKRKGVTKKENIWSCSFGRLTCEDHSDRWNNNQPDLSCYLEHDKKDLN